VAVEARRTVERLERVKHKLATTLLLVAALAAATLTGVATTARPALAARGPGTHWPIVGFGPNEATDNAILRWNERLLETIRDNPRITGPTVSARSLGILHTATYDAWAAYDPVAVDTRQRLRANPTLRRPDATPENKAKAISYAAYKVLRTLYPGRADVFSDYMRSMNYDPGDTSTDPSTPQGVGTLAADAVLAFRAGDAANQTPSTDPATGKPVLIYPDNTGYTPINKWNQVVDRTKWQQLCVPTSVTLPPAPANGTCPTTGYTLQTPATPQWKNVTPFGLLDEETHYPPQFHLPGPPSGTADVEQELKDASNLSETQKARADYWADGPRSEFPPGHWAVFAQALSRMRKNTLDQDAKLFFAVGSSLMDASISSWAAKYQYDSVRPVTAIREHYAGKMINSWLGPGKGFGSVLGQNWMPYQELTVVTPPFPEYVSGHSTFSAAARTVLVQFYGNNDAFNARVVVKAGSSKIEPGIAPTKDITITWKTLSAAADDAGWSRRWGGIHFLSGDQQGRVLGRLIGLNNWTKAQTYFNGSATDPA
jgi:Vanadium chloroperoxidase N-terminal domain/PAP2 superfamily